MTIDVENLVNKDAVKPVVLINQESASRLSFSDPTARLYIPVDRIGNVVPIASAFRLECWMTVPDKRHKHLPQILSEGRGVLTYSLIRRSSETSYGYLRRSVAVASLKTLLDWFPTLHRCTDGDVIDFDIALLF